jgi:DeoR/GlpR family transcriptional regulator of sugar metabolism
MDRLMTKTQLSEYLGVSTRTIDRYLARGVDMGRVRFRRGGVVRFDPSKIKTLIDQGGGVKKNRTNRPPARP